MAARRDQAIWPTGGRLLLAGAAGLAGLAIACGGDSSGSPTPTAADSGIVPGPGSSIPPAVIDHPSLADAGGYLDEGRYEEAAILYERVAEREDDDGIRAEALLGRAIARQESGDSEGAVESLRAAVEAAPPGGKVNTRAAYLLAGGSPFSVSDASSAARASAYAPRL